MSFMTITVDFDSPVSIEEQVYQALRRVVAAGAIAHGENLPTVRQLAADLGVHWTTIGRAYRRLAGDGILTVRRGRGATVCAPRTNKQVPAAVRATVRQKLIDAVTEARLGGMPLDQVEAALRREMALLKGEPL
jgi:GntR family transcriptional regulator